MSFLGMLIPVLTYGVLCAVLGAWVYTTVRQHWRR